MRLIDIATDKVVKVFDDFDSNVLPVAALAFSPDGTKLIAGTGLHALDELPKDAPKSGEVKVFDVTALEKPAPVGRQWTDAAVLTDHSALVNGVAVAPDGKSFAAATESNVTCWNTATHKVLWSQKLTDAPALALVYSTDGKSICVAGKTEAVRLDAATGEKGKLYDNASGVGFDNFIRSTKDSHARSLAFSQDGKQLAFSDGYAAWMVEPKNPDNYGTFSGKGPVPKDAPPVPSGVAWSSDGKRLAWIRPKFTERHHPQWPHTGHSLAGEHRQVTRERGGAQSGLFGHDHRVTAITWSKDGKAIASGDEKGWVILWNAETGKELWRRQFRGRDDTDGRINALAISPADNTVAVAVSLGSGTGAERVVLLAAKDGKDVEHLMRAWYLPVSSVAWSKDGTFLVTGCGTAGQPIKPGASKPTKWWFGSARKP